MDNKKYFTRMGDGEAVELTYDEIKSEVVAGMEDAMKKGKSDPLTDVEIEQLMDILTMPEKNVSVSRGNEGITTFDAGTLKLPVRAGVPVDRMTTLMIHERVLCSDTMELCTTDYSYKSIKNFVQEEAMSMEFAQNNCIMPIYYGAMPNVGQYTQPDGPIPNWSEMLPNGQIKEAQLAQEEAVEHAVKDMIFIASTMAEAGADGIQFDTCGASGDADMLAALKAAEYVRQHYPDTSITMGMANEFTLGMHGRLKFNNQRLAGNFPAKQAQAVSAAGANTFGCVVNTNSSKTFAWNLARSLTYVRMATKTSDIPVLPNVGMGVGGIPLTNTSPTDATTRASKAMLEIGKADGL